MLAISIANIAFLAAILIAAVVLIVVERRRWKQMWEQTQTDRRAIQILEEEYEVLLVANVWAAARHDLKNALAAKSRRGYQMNLLKILNSAADDLEATILRAQAANREHDNARRSQDNA